MKNLMVIAYFLFTTLGHVTEWKDLIPDVKSLIAIELGYQDIGQLILVSREHQDIVDSMLISHFGNHKFSMNALSNKNLSLLKYIHKISKNKKPYLDIKIRDISKDNIGLLEYCRHAKSLEIFQSDLGYELAKAVADKISDLHTLNLSLNNIDYKGAKYIAKIMSKLHTLDLSFNNIGDKGAKYIAENMMNLHILNLGCNNIGVKGAKYIAMIRSVHTLYLSLNNIGDEGAKYIAFELSKLHTLDLRCNNIGDKGARAFLARQDQEHYLKNLKRLLINDSKISPDLMKQIKDIYL